MVEGRQGRTPAWQRGFLRRRRNLPSGQSAPTDKTGFRTISQLAASVRGASRPQSTEVSACPIGSERLGVASLALQGRATGTLLDRATSPAPWIEPPLVASTGLGPGSAADLQPGAPRRRGNFPGRPGDFRPALRPSRASIIQCLIATVLALTAIHILPSINAEAWRFARQPAHVYILPSTPLPADLPPVLMVSHNAGNNRSVAERAVEFGAGAVEIDVIELEQGLSGAHNLPARFAGPIFEAPTLGQAWEWSSHAQFMKLDLKAISGKGQAQLAEFLHEQDIPPHALVIVSRHLTMLETLSEKGIQARYFLSVVDHAALSPLLEGARPPVVDGLSVNAHLLDPDRIATLKAKGYLVEAWTVNDTDQFIDLAWAGIDAVSTDNLALIEAMRSHGLPVSWMSADPAP